MKQVPVEAHLDEADQERKQLPQLNLDELASMNVTVKTVKMKHAHTALNSALEEKDYEASSATFPLLISREWWNDDWTDGCQVQ